MKTLGEDILPLLVMILKQGFGSANWKEVESSTYIFGLANDVVPSLEESTIKSLWSGVLNLMKNHHPRIRSTASWYLIR